VLHTVQIIKLIFVSHAKSYFCIRSGEEWRKIRTLLNQRLMKPRQIQEHVNDLSKISEELAEKLRVARDQNDKDKSVPNILNLFYAWSIESKYIILL
jgi:hypothetical protein